MICLLVVLAEPPLLNVKQVDLPIHQLALFDDTSSLQTN